jgi:hypothetical protein
VRSGAEDVRDAVQRVISQLDRPLADTWGCSLHGHVVTLAERLGAVASAVQRIAEGGPDCRENLIKQLAELAANAVVMLVEASIFEGEKTMNLSAQRRIENTNEGTVGRVARRADGTLGTSRSVAQSGERQPTAGRPADDDVVLFDARDRQVNPLPTTMTAAEALEDSLGPRR